jgi:hypothetical protein
MINELITTVVTDSSKSASEPKLVIASMALVAFVTLAGGLIALAAYNLAHYPELWNAITGATT